MTPPGLRLAVVGTGWAGLAAAVRATQAGWQVTLYEMAQQSGGRARSVVHDGWQGDNGQHILIGAYQRSLELMRSVGVDIAAVLLRLPLALRHADGRGLELRAGPTWPALLCGVLRMNGATFAQRLQLLTICARWMARGFVCAPGLTVTELCAKLAVPVRELLIDPLCVAALNTPADRASAAVFLRVLRDALFGTRGSSDLLIPRRPLGELLPQPALAWLEAQGASIRRGHRVMSVRRAGGGWDVDGDEADAVLLACSAAEASRLVAAAGPELADWAAAADALPYEPIISVWLEAPGVRLPAAMLALHENDDAPAQFVFDQGVIGQREGLLVAVVSGAAVWVERGLAATAEAVRRQLSEALSTWLRGAPLRVLRCHAEKRATFRCIPGLVRPAAIITRGLVAAGDYVEGPYPSTIEGAVRSAEEAVHELTRQVHLAMGTTQPRCENASPLSTAA